MAKNKQYSGPFIEVRRIGWCQNGKATSYIEFSGKRTIECDTSRPLSCLFVPLIKDVLPLLLYENADQLAEDVATMNEILKDLKFTPEKR